jgi:CSLREA domain-containing protein
MRSRHLAGVAVAITLTALAFQTAVAKVGPVTVIPAGVFPRDVAGTWVAVEPLTTGRNGLQAEAVDGTIYAMGGTRGGCPAPAVLATEAYDPVTDSWNARAAVPQPPGKPGNRTGFATAAIDGMIYAFGGGNCLEFFSDVQVYNPTTDLWSVRSKPMPSVRTSLTATALDGRIYLIGGYSNPATASASMSPTWEYDPSTQTFTTLPAIPTARIDPGVAVLGGKIYVVGGMSPAGATLANVDIYDPVAGGWTTVASLSAARRHPAVGVVNGSLYAFGGSNGAAILVSGEVYDPVRDGWDPAPSLPTGRTSAGSAVLAGVMYVIGGQSSTSGTNRDTFTFVPVTPALTTLTTAPPSGTYGGTTTLQATLSANGSGVHGKAVTFTLTIGGSTTAAGSAVTDANGAATLSGVSLAGISAGTYAGAAAASFAGDDDFLAASGAADLTVNQASPDITWTPASPIFHGTPLGSAQLNASASYGGSALPGTFVYSHTAGTVLPVGTHVLQQTFTPADTTNFMGRITYATLVVNPHPIFVVNSNADTGDAVPGDGICATAAGVCTLRAAVEEANVLPGADTIQLAATTITLARDLDVIEALTIAGSGVADTVIQGCDADANPSCAGGARLFDVQDGATLTMSGATLRNAAGGIGVGVHQPWESGYGGRAGLILTDAAILNSTGGAGITSIGDVTITHSRIAGNRVGGSYGGFPYGGGILAAPGTSLRILNSTLADNAAVAGGAIFTNSGSAVTSFTIVGTTFIGNTAAWGGAISVNGGGPYRITNTTLSGNRATTSDPSVGGGAVFAAAPIQLASVTFSRNTAVSGGAALHNYGAAVTIKNTILANSGAAHCAGSGTLTSQGYNLSDDVSCGFSATGDRNGIGAMLGPLADHGGPTLTHRPLGGSPAIDAGNPAGCTDTTGAGLADDQRGTGFPRAIDGNLDGVARCDIGAIEAPPIQPTTTTLSVTPDTPVYAQALTLMATVAGSMVTEGTVTFTEGETVLGGPVALNGDGQASVAVTLSAGEHLITATYSGSSSHEPSGDTVAVSVAKADQTINFAALPDRAELDPDFEVDASASSGLSVSFTADGQCTVTGNVVHLMVVGTCTIAASQAGSDNVNAAVPVAHTFAIRDTTPPVIGPATDITAEATSSAGAVVTFALPVAADSVDPAPLVTAAPASGGTFPLGSTTVTVTATDASGNGAMATFTVTVVDATPPVISGMPANQTLEATGPYGAPATWTAPTASDLVSGAVSASCSAASGGTIPLGTTTVTCTATDAAGNSSSASFTVIVVDTTAPVLSLPESFTVDATSPSGAAVTLTVSAVDLVVGTVSVVCTPSPDSQFAIGVTTVGCTAADARGNTTAGAFDITVRSPAEMTANLLNAVNSYGFTQVDRLLRSVLLQISRSNVTAACNQLRAFTNQVNAQAGKTLTAAQVSELTAATSGIQAALGCR